MFGADELQGESTPVCRNLSSGAIEVDREQLDMREGDECSGRWGIWNAGVTKHAIANH
jgi:hypothetical protein